jgi:23S rRNA (cytidine1920-2'-O)/16S rRNA (cytidine1409-2'-O)-methyltransferase
VHLIADKKERLDKLLVDLKAAPTRAKARALIMGGFVKVDSQIADKAGAVVKPGSSIDIVERAEFVSRGGEKLQAALDHFRPDLDGKVALDVGASTGGFTDCLLRNGVRKVYAVDVGYGQLAWQLRNDRRVVVMERVNARNLTKDLFDETPQFATIDVSFISLTLVLPPVATVLTDDARILALIKPQFEAGREHVGKGGVIRDEEVHRNVVEKIQNFAPSIGFFPKGVIESPLLGPAGNKEFFIYLVRNAPRRE